MHKRMIAGVMASLDTERAAYFHKVLTVLDADPRTESRANMVYLVLKETMTLLPLYLEPEALVERLFAFIEDRYGILRKTLFDEAYVRNPTIIQAVTNLFIEEIVALTLSRFQEGAVDTGETLVQKFTWPYRASDLIDPDAEDETEEPPAPSYTGLERRKPR
ncbi:MAG: hypothetical protein A2516_03245 [Alphaproteobacteria bacterium RIFOXYD12_FULL_60_8]|nr:MAG: hypothetical protein A2516_03245 [Alphaproteobacteria bacterium RIFOXYD12_FULL_60_8]